MAYCDELVVFNFRKWSILNIYDFELLWNFEIQISKTIKAITSADNIGQAHCFQIPILEFCITRKRKRKSKLFAVPTSWKVELFFPNRQICVVDIQSYHIYVHLIWFLNNNVVLIHIVYSISFVIAAILLRIDVSYSTNYTTLHVLPWSRKMAGFSLIVL